MRKGISPLLGALVLVGIVIGVTSMVAPVILDFAEEQTENASQRSMERTDCSRSGIGIDNVTCIDNGSFYELRIEVINTGYQDLTGFHLQVREDDGYRDYGFSKSDKILRPDDSMVFINGSFNYTGGRGRFISETCPTTASRDLSSGDFPC